MGTLWNSYSFFCLYASVDEWKPSEKNKMSKNLLDRWILSELNQLIQKVDESMQKYVLTSATKPIEEFVDNLSNWYIRRSRRRFWKSESDDDKKDAYQTLYVCLVELAKLIAPFCPFVADEIYQNLVVAMKDGAPESVHLSSFPKCESEFVNLELSGKMALTRKIVEVGLSLRAEGHVKVRQPLGSLSVEILDSELKELPDDFCELIRDEVNVKSVLWEKTKKSGNVLVRDDGQ